MIHEDGGIVYDPYYREARRTGQLASYEGAPVNQHDLDLGGYHLRFSVPRRAVGYDVIPISYRLTWDPVDGDTSPVFPVAVEATAFEEESRRKGRDLFDLALPGRLDLDVEYLGSVTAHTIPNGRHNLKPDMSDLPGRFPPFERRPMVKSGVVEAGDLVWFKFRYTNAGNTILDAEGLGGCLFYPQLLRKNEQGKYEVVGEPYNLYYRDLEYLYPGESHEIWLHCTGNMPGFAEGAGKSGTPQGFGIASGDYIFRFRMMYRNYKTPDIFMNIWEGPEMFIGEMRFFLKKLRETLSTPLARQSRASEIVVPDQGWRKGAKALPSYRMD